MKLLSFLLLNKALPHHLMRWVLLVENLTSPAQLAAVVGCAVAVAPLSLCACVAGDYERKGGKHELHGLDDLRNVRR